MDFTSMKRLVVPEGEVKKIEIDGNTVWETPAQGVTAITTTSLPNGTSWSSNSNITYSGSLAYTGVTLEAVSDLPVTWSATGLPSGLSINPNTGVISGTIAKDASADYTRSIGIIATTTKNSLSKTLTLKVYKYKGPTQINNTSLPDGECKFSYTNTTITSNSTNTITWSATGLPSGLTINASTGVISGTITAENLEDQTYTVTLQATDGFATISKSLTMKVVSCSPCFSSSNLTFTNNRGTSSHIIRDLDKLNTPQTVTCYHLADSFSEYKALLCFSGSPVYSSLSIAAYRRSISSTGTGTKSGTVNCSVSGETITITPSLTSSVLEGSNASQYEIITPSKGSFSLKVELKTKKNNTLVKEVSIPISFKLY